nr:unnamed protein product [Callosobruchus analis]
MFRLTKELALTLINSLDEYLVAPTRKSAIDKQTKVLVALHFFATGSYQIDIGYNLFCALSRAAVSRCIDEVVNALNQSQIINRWIHFPRSREEMQNSRLQFYSKYRIPGVIGVIDCTHVAIFPPSAGDAEFPEHIYVNRKHYHSLNVQLICDANLKIINVNAKFPGSSHDSYIWSRSNVQRTMRQINQRHSDFFLIGDSGYPLRPWLQTPVRNPLPGTPEFHYNEAFLLARSTIERCNGILKMRFRCLLKHRVLHYTPTKCSKIILACAVLHNMCIENDVPMPENEENVENFDLGIIDDNNDEEITGHNIDLIAGQRLQRQLIRTFVR